MKKKFLLVILICIIFVLSLVSILVFTDMGNSVINKIYTKSFLSQEESKVDGQNTIKVTYTYGGIFGRPDSEQKEILDVQIDDKELIKNIGEALNKELVNYNSEIGLIILGDYTVDLGDGVKFKFDNYESEGFVRMYNNNGDFLTRINPEIPNRIRELVDVKLTEKSKMFQTDKITISDMEDTINVDRKTMIEILLEQCKYIYIKGIVDSPKLGSPEYTLDFNNGVKIYKYEDTEKGYVSKDGTIYEALYLNVFDYLLENLYEEIDEKQKWFVADKLTISTPQKTVEVTDKNVVEKITSHLMFSNLLDSDWLKNYNLEEEKSTGIKVKINNVVFLIPEGKNNGNRYLILPNGEVMLCFPMEKMEQYIQGCL